MVTVMSDLRALLDDLLAEGASLDAMVAELDDWSVPTPAEGWTIAHQIAHLTWTDDASIQAVSDTDGFQAQLALAMKNPTGFVDAGAFEIAADPDLLSRWRTSRSALAAALAAVPPGTKLQWFGPPMSPMSMATARLMETWAHGQDVADALGVERAPSARLRHVAHISVRTRDFAYQIRGLTPPSSPFHVALTAPDGTIWTWGPSDAAQSVTGPALDFCLLATQRRHRSDTTLHTTGPDADQWLNLAQAFAGLPGPGRPPLKS
jgi:uncharacterized protein (TIGR03084 family)